MEDIDKDPNPENYASKSIKKTPLIQHNSSKSPSTKRKMTMVAN